MVYKVNIAGLERELPVCPISDELYIAGFVVFGDVELTNAVARELLKLAPEYDYLVAPEAKAIPIVHEMARQSGRNKYVLARKAKKAYMSDVLEVNDVSITTAGTQKLYMNGADAAMIKGKRVVLVDDVVSTGGSLRALESLVEQAGADIVAKLCVYAEGDAKNRSDIRFLSALPLFDKNGNPLG